MSTSSLPRRLVSITVGAETLGVHQRTLRRYIANGHLTGYRIGPRTLRVDADELEAFATGNPVR